MIPRTRFEEKNIEIERQSKKKRLIFLTSEIFHETSYFADLAAVKPLLTEVSADNV